MTRPQDDPELFKWIQNASERGGSFVKHLALAALYADANNYPLLHPVILTMREKYPAYSGRTTDPRQNNLMW